MHATAGTESGSGVSRARTAGEQAQPERPPPGWRTSAGLALSQTRGLGGGRGHPTAGQLSPLSDERCQTACWRGDLACLGGGGGEKGQEKTIPRARPEAAGRA